MPNVYVSGYAWVDVESYDLKRISEMKRGLTLHPRRTSRYRTEPQKPIELYRQKDALFGVPRQYFLRNRTIEHRFVDRTVAGRPWPEDVRFNPSFVLRDDQPAAVAAILGCLRPPFAGLIVEAPTGWGKTLVALYAAWKIGVMTLVLVPHSKKIMKQWVTKAQEYLPGARVGMAYENHLDADVDVLVAISDSMVTREKEWEPVADQIGFVITDEVDKIGAPTWAPLMPRFPGRYRLGLTAKARRKDGCDRVFLEHIGPRAFRGTVRRVKADVYFRHTGWRPIETPTFNPEKVGEETIVSIMIGNEARNGMIVRDIVRAATAGRKVVVFSDRRKHLDTLREMFARIRPAKVTDGFLRGGMSEAEERQSDKCDVLWATYEFLERAYDNDAIDTVVLATPVSDPEQAVGRGTRWKEGKKGTVVLDYVDDGPAFVERRYESRRKVYASIEASMKRER